LWITRKTNDNSHYMLWRECVNRCTIKNIQEIVG
jgi:hypothetical protein